MKPVCPQCSNPMRIFNVGEKKFIKKVRVYKGISNLWKSPQGMIRFFPLAFKYHRKGHGFWDLDFTILNFRFWIEVIP